MLPRLRAEEALCGVSILHAGDSMIKVEPRQRMIAEWQEQADPGARQPQTLRDLGGAMQTVFGLV